MNQCFVSLPSDCVTTAVVASLVPAEVDLAWTVGSLLHQGLVKLSSGAGVDVGPAELAVVLQAGDVRAEKGSEFPSTASTLTLITQLIVQDVGLHLHLRAHISEKMCINSHGTRRNVRVDERPQLVAVETGEEANSISPNHLLLTMATSCCCHTHKKHLHSQTV